MRLVQGFSIRTALASVPCWLSQSGTLLFFACVPWWSSCASKGGRQSPGQVQRVAVLLQATPLPAVLWRQLGFKVTALLPAAPAPPPVFTLGS